MDDNSDSKNMGGVTKSARGTLVDEMVSTGDATPLPVVNRTARVPAQAPAAAAKTQPSAPSGAAAAAAQKNQISADKFVRSILVSPRQKGNPLLRAIRNVPWEYAPVVGDYQLGVTTCALFLSLRYHLLHPNYLITRLQEARRSAKLHVLLVLVDMDDVKDTLRDIQKTALLSDFTLVLAWSQEEAARYLETYKAYENKKPDSIQERTDGDYTSTVTAALTEIRAVNKQDVTRLLTSFGSMRRLGMASMDELALCPGIGPKKVKSIYEAFHEPFYPSTKTGPEPTDKK